MTTLIGGGTGPAEGTKATTVTPGRVLARRDAAGARRAGRSTWCCSARATRCRAEGLWEQLRAGAAGFKLHEDWGTTPAAIDACLTRGAGAPGVQVAIHTDTLNEAGYLESTLAAIGGRPIHTYHTEGAGGGHAPDIITGRLARRTCCRPRPTRPGRTPRNTLDEHLDMLMVCHHLNPSMPEDLAFAESPDPAVDDGGRGRAARPRRDLDDRLGLPGDGPDRRDDHPHLADRARDEAAPRLAARRRRGRQPAGPPLRRQVHDRARPSTHGLDGEIGSVEPGKLADLVLWEPAFFGVRPHVVLKGGRDRLGATWATPTPRSRPRSRSCRGRCSARSARCRRGSGVHFVSPAALEAGLADRWDSRPPAGRHPRRVAAVARPTCRENDALPRIDVDTETFAVRIDGELIEPAAGRRAADGPALLPVLMALTRAAAAAARLARAGRRARPLRRDGGRGHGRAGARPGDVERLLPRPAAHVGPGRRRVRRRGVRAGPRRASADGRLAPSSDALDAESTRGRRRRRCGPPRGSWAAGCAALLRSMLAAAGPTAWRAGAPHHPLVLGAGVAARRRRPGAGRPGRRARRRSPRRPAPPSGCSASTRSPCRPCWPGWRPDRRAGRRVAAAGRRPRPSCRPTAAPALDLLADVHLTAEVRLFAS